MMNPGLTAALTILFLVLAGGATFHAAQIAEKPRLPDNRKAWGAVTLLWVSTVISMVLAVSGHKAHFKEELQTFEEFCDSVDGTLVFNKAEEPEFCLDGD